MYTLGDRVQMVSSLPDDKPSVLDLRTGTVVEPPYTSGEEALVGVEWDIPMGGDNTEVDFEPIELLQHEDFFQ